CFVDSKCTSADFFAVELGDCFHRSGVVCHLHKAETFRASGNAICDDLNGFNLADLAEHVTEIRFCGLKREISNVDLLGHAKQYTRVEWHRNYRRRECGCFMLSRRHRESVRT